MFFKDCFECEIFILGMVLLVAITIDYVRCKKRAWGENPPDAKYTKE